MAEEVVSQAKAFADGSRAEKQVRWAAQSRMERAQPRGRGGPLRGDAQSQRGGGGRGEERKESAHDESVSRHGIRSESRALLPFAVAQGRLPTRALFVPCPPAQHIFSELANAQNAPNSTMGRMVAELAAIGKTIEINETLAEEEKRRAAESKVETDKLEVRSWWGGTGGGGGGERVEAAEEGEWQARGESEEGMRDATGQESRHRERAQTGCWAKGICVPAPVGSPNVVLLRCRSPLDGCCKTGVDGKSRGAQRRPLPSRLECGGMRWDADTMYLAAASPLALHRASHVTP